MKKKALITLLALSMTAAMITGCGNKPSQSQAAETTQESTAEASEESVESSTEESEPSSDAESGTEATDEETKPASSEEPTEAQAEESKEPSQEASKESESASNATEPAAESASVAQAETTPEVTPASTEAPAPVPVEQPQAPDYTVTPVSATMYVKNSVNLRQGPGSSYAKVGSLNKGDQVTVTGQADNGWYQLDSGAFVSNKYLDNTAPAATTATAPGTTVLPTDQMETTITVSTGLDFLNYLNQQRSAAGLGTLTWDSDMAAVAQRRAQEITKGLDHSGNVEQYGEVIQQAISGSATEWYTNWYNSEAHRTSMFGKNYTRAGVGVYAVGNNYFVVCNFEGDPISAEEQLEQLKPENLLPAGGNESGTVNSFSTTGETLEADDPDYGFIYDLIEQEREQYNQ